MVSARAVIARPRILYRPPKTLWGCEKWTRPLRLSQSSGVHLRGMFNRSSASESATFADDFATAGAGFDEELAGGDAAVAFAGAPASGAVVEVVASSTASRATNFLRASSLTRRLAI